MYQRMEKDDHAEETRRTCMEMSAIEHQVASGCMDVSSGSFHLTSGHAMDEFSSSSFPQEEQKKQNHSEIEKRRREKMNSCIRELAGIIPVCSGMSRKLDKLTVLRMAVQHLKTIKGSLSAFMPGSQARPAFLSERKIHELILQVAEGFLFVVSCDRGKILFVSESVSEVLNYSREELLGQNWFDILHPKDVAKVKEQLTSNDLMKKKERFVDAKTLLPVESDFRSGSAAAAAAEASAAQSHGLSAFSPGARRSFFCRMKCKSQPKGKEEADTTTGQKKRKNSSEKKYSVIYCMGYIKSWSSTAATRSAGASGLANDSAEDSEDSGCNLSCLVAAARTLPPFTAPTASTSGIPTEAVEFVSRHSMDGKFLFVDQRAVFIMGFLPQELLGTSNYEYCHPDDVKFLADAHRRALACNTEVNSGCYRFKTKSGSYLYMQTTWKTFKNPWTKDFEFLVARNTCVPAPDSDVGVESSNYRPESSSHISPHSGTHLSPLDQMIKKISKSGPSSSNENSSGSSSETRVRKLLSSSRVNLWKIGKQIAEEAMDNQKKYENESIGSISSRSNISSNVSSPCLSNEASGGENLSAKNGSNGGGGTSDPGSHNSEGSSGNSIYSSNFFANQLEQDQSSDVSIPVTSQRVSQSTTTRTPDPSSLVPPTELPHYHTNDPLLVSAAVSSSDPSDGLSVSAPESGISGRQSSDPQSGSQVVASSSGAEPAPGDMDEAAMALVMSLLEADAGLGGPVDFSGLPWPLF